MSPNPKVGSAFCTFSYNLKSIVKFRNASMAPSPPTTPHPLFPVQQVNSSSSSTSSLSSWSRSLLPPTSCSAALRLQWPQSLSTWIKTSPHFHFLFSTPVVSTSLFIFTFLHLTMGYKNLSLSLLIGVNTSPEFSFSFHFSNWVMTSPHFHFHFFQPDLSWDNFHQHESGHLLISTFSIQPKIRPLFTFTLSIGVKTSAHYHFHFSAMESASLNSILDTQQQNFFAQE